MRGNTRRERRFAQRAWRRAPRTAHALASERVVQASRRAGTSRARAARSALAFAASAWLAGCAMPGVRDEPVFYRPLGVGTERQFDPLRSGAQYALDGAQIEGAGTDDYGEHLQLVWDHLREPVHTIERSDGGWRDFVNSEILPIDPENAEDSLAILPNVFLHTLGGGMLFRKTAEWLAAHDVPEPGLCAGLVAMATEVLGEASEKPATDDTDEIADVLIFRPLGMWLFADADRARWVHDELGLVDWPYLLMWDVDDEDFANVGTSYCFRPAFLGDDDTRPFAYVGITNVFGLSHRVAGADRVSWGVGTATLTVEPVELRWSAGVFWDRDRGLLASLIANGADGYAVRANVYPGALLDADVPLGLFGGVGDDGRVTIGVQFALPIGVAW
jgi:hypothetical protein